MLEAGLKVSGSSDAPVEPISPVLGIWAAVTRDSQAQNERLNLLEALKLYTLNAAYNSGDEDTLGSVREGGPGDVTLLDSNVRDMHPQMIRKVGIAATIVGGEIAFSYEGYV
jgi:predicted amidohydrolase YtcJ